MDCGKWRLWLCELGAALDIFISQTIDGQLTCKTERKRQTDKERETGRQIETDTHTHTTLFIFLWPALCALLLCAFRLITDNKNKLVLPVKLGYRVAKKLENICRLEK